MAYLTLEELQTRLKGELGLKQLTRSETINVDFINAALDDASSAVDEFAVGTQDYPWAVVPSQAVDATFNIARAYLYQRSWSGTPMPLHISEPYSQTRTQLKDLRDKNITWVTTNAPEIANKSEAFVSLPNEAPTYNSPRQARLGRLRRIL